MTGSPTAKDYMTTDLVTFTPDMDIHRAMKVLLQKDFSGATVVDAQGGVVGVLSEKDCLRIAFSASYHRELGGPVSEYMSRNVETVAPDTDIVAVAERFLKSRYRRFPVVAGDRLVGQISRRDVLKALEDLW